MRELTAAEEARARDLHRGSVVVDTLSAFGPSVYPPKTVEALDAAIAAGRSVSAAVTAMFEATTRALARGEVPGFWEGWEAAGVDAASVTLGAFGEPPFTYENAVNDLALFSHVFDSVPDRLVKVTRAADIERAKAEGKRSVILNFQNTTHIGDDLDKLRFFHELGIRVIQLTYNSRNLVGDGCTERVQSGLSDFGVQVVKRMNELGILVDVSHCSEATTLDAIEVSERPVAVTHAFSRVVSDHDRGKSDEVIRAVADNDGYFGVCVVPFFITDAPRATLDHWLDHVDRVVELAGAEHVGIGTDWGEELPKQLVDLLNEEMRRFGFREEHRVDWAATLDGYERWQDWPTLTRALVARGYSDDEIRGLLGANFLRVFEAAVG